MRWILLTFVLTSLCFCGLREAVLITDAHPETFWSLIPGEQSESLSDLDPIFRNKARRILEALKQEGYPVKVVTTWRSPLRQEMLYAYSQLRTWVGLGTATQRAHQTSCHSRLSSQREPAALALDLRLDKATSLKEHAAFFHRLGVWARYHGVRWGGDWTQKNSKWRVFNLGWDPGHLESSRCP